MTLDPQDYARQRVAHCTGEMGWNVANKANPKEWQDNLRARLAQTLALDKMECCPLDARIVETLQLDGYRRETVHLETRSGLTAMGYFLVQDHGASSQPTIICLPGHGRGVDAIVGIAEDGAQRPLSAPRADYSADFALQCVAHGWPTFALEQISFGHRCGAASQKGGAGASSCREDSMAALMMGETITGWRVWDVLRVVDYLETRAEVDASQIATMGISGGGLTALFATALDTRIAACVVSGYLNTFADSILAVGHCVDNYAPGLLTLCEMPDIAGLVAPRPLFCETGDRDPIFPLAGFRKAESNVREIYGAFDAADNFATDVFDGAHEFHGAGAFAFLHQLFA